MNLKTNSNRNPRQFRHRFASALMLCLLTLLLTLSLTNYAYSSTQNEIVFKYVPQGFSAPATGYWADEPTGRNLLHMIRTYREQSEYWEKAHGALSEEFKAYIDKTNERLTTIETNIEAERRAWKNEIRKAKLPGVGVFAGAGYGSAGQVQGVVGVGLVWRLW